MTVYDLAAMSDRGEITDQLTRYCRAMDRCDHALGYSVFDETAVADYGAMYQGTGRGFVDFALAAHKGLLVHNHQISNILIAFDSGRANSETYVTMMARMDLGGGRLHDMRSLGRYIDRWTKREGAWRISHRRYIHEFDDNWPVTNARYPVAGRRDESDASYEALYRGNPL
jgi:hypothetical protein